MTIMFTRTSAAGLALAASFMGAPLGLAQATKQADQSPQQVDSALASRVGATAASWDALAKEFGGYKSETKPSRDAVMQFAQSGEIRLISVSGGQRVKRGDVLARVRDAEVVAAIARQKIVAENRLEIDNAERQLELAQYRFEQLKAGKTFSPAEFEELRISAEVAKIQRDQAIVNLEAQKIALDQLLGQAERYRLEAPFDGVVEEVMVEVGQGVTENEKVLRIVNTETLWLDAYAGTSESIRLGLKENSPAWVLIELADAPRLVKGTVLYVSPVADAVSQTRRVRVEIQNTENWPAGTQARVRFTEPSGEWEKYSTPTGRSRSAAVNPPEFADQIRGLLNERWSPFAYRSAPYMPSTEAALSQIERFCRMDLYSSALWATPEEWQTRWLVRPRIGQHNQPAEDEFTRQEARAIAYGMVAKSFGDKTPLDAFETKWFMDSELASFSSKLDSFDFKPNQDWVFKLPQDCDKSEFPGDMVFSEPKNMNGEPLK